MLATQILGLVAISPTALSVFESILACINIGTSILYFRLFFIHSLEASSKNSGVNSALVFISDLLFPNILNLDW